MSFAVARHTMQLPYRYRLFGLCTHSEIDLGDVPLAGAGEAEVMITRGPVPAPPKSDAWFEVSPGRAVIEAKPVARFLVEGGRRIVVDGGMDASAGLRWRLLGAAFGVLLHQRGILPLHATVISIGGRAVGLTGPSGTGKSTLAGFLCRRGHQLLIDDVCATAVERGQVLVEPGHGRLRLWQDAMEALEARGGELLAGGQDKYEFSARIPAPGRVRLSGLVEIATGETIRLVRLDLGESLALCLRNTYYRPLLKEMGRTQANFLVCSQLAALVPCFRLERPLGFGIMDRVAGVLEDRVAKLDE